MPGVFNVCELKVGTIISLLKGLYQTDQKLDLGPCLNQTLKTEIVAHLTLDKDRRPLNRKAVIFKVACSLEGFI